MSKRSEAKTKLNYSSYISAHARCLKREKERKKGFSLKAHFLLTVRRDEERNVWTQLAFLCAGRIIPTKQTGHVGTKMKRGHTVWVEPALLTPPHHTPPLSPPWTPANFGSDHGRNGFLTRHEGRMTEQFKPTMRISQTAEYTLSNYLLKSVRNVTSNLHRCVSGFCSLLDSSLLNPCEIFLHL